MKMDELWKIVINFQYVPETIEKYSRYNPMIIKNDIILPAYYEWQEKGFNNKYAVRYPVGFNHRHQCLFSIKEGQRLDYIESRKQIYVPLYQKLVKDKPQFIELKTRLLNGENLLIIEVDGPHQESLNYYKKIINLVMIL